MTQSVPFSVAVALGLITLLAPVSVDMYLPSLPVMAEEMNTTYPAMQLTLMVFLLAMGAGQIVFGPVIDAYGRRRPLLVALAIFVVVS
ncbi:MFS transporter, partial [Bradyrhizobium sp.]